MLCYTWDTGAWPVCLLAAGQKWLAAAGVMHDHDHLRARKPPAAELTHSVFKNSNPTSERVTSGLCPVFDAV